MLCKVTHCAGRVSANTRPHQLRWGDREMGHVSAFRFPIVSVLRFVAITTTHCTVHMSQVWQGGVAAWAHATYPLSVILIT